MLTLHTQRSSAESATPRRDPSASVPAATDPVQAASDALARADRAFTDACVARRTLVRALTPLLGQLRPEEIRAAQRACAAAGRTLLTEVRGSITLYRVGPTPAGALELERAEAAVQAAQVGVRAAERAFGDARARTAPSGVVSATFLANLDAALAADPRAGRLVA